MLGNGLNKRKVHNILVVDDEQHILEALKEMLEFWNYNVFLAKNVSSAISILTSNNISIVITDIKMEETDSGFQLIEKVKELKPETIIIAITGSFNDESVINRCIQYDVLFLQKPLRANEVKTLIAKCISQKEQEDELKSDIKIAKQIIDNTFPKCNPDCNLIDIFSYYKPVFDIGGDFYDFIKLSNGNHLIYICDVEGHGIHSALFAHTIKTYVKAFSELTCDIDKIVTKLNNSLCIDTCSKSMATAFFACFDSNNKILRYVNAGHEPAILFKASTNEFMFLEATNTIIGIFENIDYSFKTINLDKDDILFIYTDGLYNDDINLSSKTIDTIKKTILKNKNKNVKLISQKIMFNLQQNIQSNYMLDDIAYLTIKVN